MRMAIIQDIFTGKLNKQNIYWIIIVKIKIYIQNNIKNYVNELELLLGQLNR
jgi:hypothetical protein